jgi:hypothetical protein
MRLKQTVIFNALRENDGMFKLFVGEQPMIYRTDIFYRHITQQVRKNESTGKRSPTRLTLL